MTRPNATLLDLLLELQALDNVPRIGYSLRGVAEPESVAEHSFHTAFLVWALGAREAGLDLLRAVELALVHDLAEVRIGDLPRTATGYFPAGAKHAAEHAAITEILAPLGDRGPALYAEYQRAETREARFVAACDKLQLLIKASVYERAGNRALADLLARSESLVDHGFDSIRTLVGELIARRG
ncbi:MAG: HD domain-containing protein [Thermoanaerobaculia bacterium]|nr:HD domain-containing protein [Thermoanaerobaculia bacterium]